MECSCHMLRSSRVSGWRCLMWNRNSVWEVFLHVSENKRLPFFHFPGQDETMITIDVLLSRSGWNDDCGWCLIIQVRMKRWSRLTCFYYSDQDETMTAVGLFLFSRSGWSNDGGWCLIIQVRMKWPAGAKMMIVIRLFSFSRLRWEWWLWLACFIFQVKVKFWLPLTCFHLPSQDETIIAVVTFHFPGQDEMMIAVGLGYSCHLTIKMSQILGLPLRHPMENRSSRSVIYDQVHSKLADKDREWVAPPALFLNLSTTTFVMALARNMRLPQLLLRWETCA